MKNQSLLFGFVAALMLSVGVGVAIAEHGKAHDLAAWETFKATHRCEAVSHEPGVPYKVVTYGPKNEVNAAMAMTPTRTAWRCDDGTTRVVEDGGAPSSVK